MSKVAVCQILSTNDPAHNLKVSSRVVRDAAAAGATVSAGGCTDLQACFLPEASDFIATSAEECRGLSVPLSKHKFALGLQEVAKELGVVISVGVHDIPEEHEDDDEPEGSLRVFNTHILIGRDGSILARYSKVIKHWVWWPLTPAAPVRRGAEPATAGRRDATPAKAYWRV